jgi:uncharacterized membrane protein
MNRFNLIDNIRGIAFILMFIQHIFYFYDVNNAYSTSISSHPLISFLGILAHHLFLFLTGYSLVMTFNNKTKNIKSQLYDRLKRSLHILCHAFIISCTTFYFYPDYFVRFGVLHFISVATFILSPIIPYKSLYPILLFITIYLKTNKYIIPSINPIIDTIIGTRINYNMMDCFPLIQYMPIVVLGMMSSYIDKDILLKLDVLNEDGIITKIGRNTLNLYTLHFVSLILFYVYFFRKKNYNK